MPTSFDQFVKRLTASRLITAETLRLLLDELPRAKRPQDGQALAKWLVKQDYLTPYQAQQVYHGRTKGLVLGNYVILDKLGAGGMGQVFKAEHLRMKRLVALKVLPEDVAEDKSLIARFQREVQAAAKLMHPNIVTAFDADVADGTFFLVMEYVPGKDLATIVKKQGPLPVEQAIDCILDTARGLEYAHRHGVIHRDVKPANLLLASGGRQSSKSSDEDSASESERSPQGADASRSHVKILDMGLARIEDASADVATQAELTGTGMVMGTIDYMPPEQALNTKSADHRSDVYSLGITLFYLLIGKPAYAGDSVMERLLAHRESPIPSLRSLRADVPRGLDDLFAKMVAKQPDDRFQTMSEAVRALEALQSNTAVPLPGDETAIGASDQGDSALLSFLNTIENSTQTKAEVLKAPKRVVTQADGEVAETVIAQAEDPTATVVKSSNTDSIPRRRSRQPGWLWPSIIGGGVLTLSAVLVQQFRSPQPPESAPQAIRRTENTDAETHTSLQASALTSSPDRHVAEVVLQQGGHVTVQTYEGRLIGIASPNELPTEEFLLLKVTQQQQSDRPLSDDDLDGLHHLTQFAVRSQQITDAGLKHLAENTKLDNLFLDTAHVTGAGLESLSNLPMLHRLILLGCSSIDDSAVAVLPSLTRLQELDLKRTSVSEAGIDRLRQLMPACWIKSDYGTFPPGGSSPNAPAATLSADTQNDANPAPWENLFDGSDTSAWQDLGPFRVEDGLLVADARGSAVTRKQYGNFDLEFDWRLAQGGNSGVYYRSPSGSNAMGPGIEFQLLGNTAYGPDLDPRQRTGSLYNFAAAADEIDAPPEQWHRSRIHADGGQVEHWVNDVLAVRYDLDSPEGELTPENVRKALRNRLGHILLQSHTGKIAFRKIRVRELMEFGGAANGPPSTDLLALVDPQRDALRLEQVDGKAQWKPGGWTHQQGGWLSEPGTRHLLRMQIEQPPGHYTLTVESEPTGSGSAGWVVLPVGKTHCFFLYNGFQSRKAGEAISGFGMVDGKPEDQNETTRRHPSWPVDKPLRLQFEVDVAGDQVTLVAANAGNEVSRYYGPIARLSIATAFLQFYDGTLATFGVGTTDEPMRFQNVTLIDRSHQETADQVSAGVSAADDGSLLTGISLSERHGYVAVPIEIGPDDPVTLEMWVTSSKAAPDRTSRPLLTLEGRVELKQYGPNWDLVGTERDGVDSVDRFVQGRNAVRPGHRTHLAAVVAQDQLALYVDGRLVGRNRYNALPEKKHPLTISQTGLSAGDGGYQPFVGIIDDVRISRGARYHEDFTPAQQFTADASTWVLYNIDEGTGDVLHDVSGNGHDGTIYEATWLTRTIPSVDGR